MKLTVEVIPFPEMAHHNRWIQTEISAILAKCGKVSAEGTKHILECPSGFDYEDMCRSLSQKYGGYCDVRTHCKE